MGLKIYGGGSGGVSEAALATNLSAIRVPQVIRGLVRLPTFTEFSFPMRIAQYEPSRRILRVLNTGPATVQVAAKNAINTDFNAPSAAQWAAGDLIAPGQEVVVAGNQLTHFMRTAATGQTASVVIYTELVV